MTSWRPASSPPWRPRVWFSTPSGWEISPARSLAINLEQAHCNVPLARVTIEITPHNLTQSRYDLILQVTSDGHHTQSLIPIVLLTGGDYQIFSE